MKHFSKAVTAFLATAVVTGSLFGGTLFAAPADETPETTDVEVTEVEEDDCKGMVKVKSSEKEELFYGPDFDPEAIIGKDTRTKISDTTKYPYSAISHMYMVYSCGCAGYGTGFMVSDNTMLTAGHCVICSTHKGKLKSLSSKFGYNPSNGSYTLAVNGCKTFYYDQDYYNGTRTGINQEDGDYAAIVFGSNVGAITGHYGIKAFTDSELKGVDFKIGGYCRDTDPLMMATGKVNPGIVYKQGGKTYKYSDANLLSYSADTIPGNSGGPVFDKNNMIAGIHVAGNATAGFNLARRVTKSLMTMLKNNKLITSEKSVKPAKKAKVVSVADNKTISYKLENGSKVSLQIPKAALTSIKWTSSDSSVASVDGIGILSGKKIGKAVLTGNHNGATITVKVDVVYKDVKDSSKFWYTPTYYLSEKDVVKGYDNQTKFKPANNCTRAQMVAFLWRLAGNPAPKASTTKFTDVKKGTYYYKAVIWAVEKGITTGTSKTKFSPSGVCTRAQTVTFLWRMAGKPSTGNAKNPFKDVKKSNYFYNAVIWASGKKIVAGYSDGTFKPSGKCLRRQMVTFLYKYDKVVNKGKSAPKPTTAPKPTSSPKPTTAPVTGNASESEPNNTPQTATVLSLGKVCKGEIGDYTKWQRDGLDEDWFVFNVTAGKTYTFTMNGFSERYDPTTLLINGYEPGADLTDSFGSYNMNFTMERNKSDSYSFTPATSGKMYVRIWNFFNSNGDLSSTNYSVVVK